MSDDIDEVSLDDDMAAILADINAGDEGDDDAGNTDETDGRDERGRFKAKSAVSDDGAMGDGGKAGDAISGDDNGDAADGALPVGDDQGQNDAERDNKASQRDDLARPPSTWRAAAKAQWNELPPWAREEILKREQDAGAGIGQYKQAADYGNAMHAAVAPYMPMIQASGTTPQAAIQSLLNTAYRLRSGTPQERGQMLLQVAQQYGADLSVLGQQPDPQAQHINQFLAPLQTEVQQLRQEAMARRQHEAQQQHTYATSTVTAFQNELDDTGKPKHLYFDEVRAHMADLIDIAESQGRELSLNDAYDAAVWARPDLRQLLIAEQQRAAEAKRADEAKKRAAEAQRTARTNVRSGGAPRTATTAPTGSIDDTLRAAMQDIRARND